MREAAKLFIAMFSFLLGMAYGQDGNHSVLVTESNVLGTIV